MTVLWLHSSAREPAGRDDDGGDDRSAALARAMPPEVGQYVADFVARQRLVSLAAALGWTLVTLLGWLLLWALVDRLAPLPPRARLGLLVGDVVIVVGLLSRPCIALVRGRRNIDWARAAASIESREPAFDERLVTVTTQLLSPPRLRGSPQMLDQLLADVAARTRGRRGGSLISAAPMRRAWFAAAGAVGLVALLSFWSWLDLPALLLRQLQPASRIAAVTTTRLTVEPGNVSVIAGQSIRIGVRADRLPARDADSVTLEISHDGETWTPQSMTPSGAGGDGRYGFTLGPVDRDCHYRVSGGDARSGVYTVRVLRRPAVLRYRVRLSYPQYLLRGPAASALPPSLTNTDGRISAPAGTEVTLAIEASEPLRAAMAVFSSPGGGAPKRIRATQTARPEVRELRFTVRESGSYRVDLTSQQGVRGDSTDLTVRAIPDRAPQVRLVLPAAARQQLLVAAPWDVFELPFRATDDHGVAGATVTVTGPDGQKYQQPVDVARDALPSHDVADLARTDLARGALTVGQVLSVEVTVRDEAGQEATSEPCRLIVAPSRIDLRTLWRRTLLDEAAHTADALAADIEDAGRNLDEGGAAGAATAATAQRAALVPQALLRVLPQVNDPMTATALAAWADLAQRIATRLRYGRHVDSLLRESRRLASDVRTIADADRAALVQALRSDRQALTNLRPMANRSRGRRAMSVDQLDRVIDGELDTLSISPDDPMLDQRLAERVGAATRLLRSVAGRPAKIGGSDDPGEDLADFADRLAIAGHAEAMRPEADYARAADLLLAADAARAAAPSDLPAIARFAATAGGPARQAAEDARKPMRQLVSRANPATMTEAREAVEVCAAWSRQLQSPAPTSQPNNLPPAVVEAVEMTRLATALTNPRGDPSPSLRRVEAITESVRDDPRLHLAASLMRMPRTSTINPVDRANGTAARLALEGIGREHPRVIAGAAAEQALSDLKKPHDNAFASDCDTVASGLRREAHVLLHDAARQELAKASALSSLLDPERPDGDIADRNGAGPVAAEPPAPANVPPQAMPEAADLPGYEDALQAYAEALRGARKKPAMPPR